jgi:4-amino-4-deoxy-L-arabinose transferase-like glycosyltransferase
MHMAVATIVAGEEAAFLVGPLAAIAAIVLLYLLARDFGLPPPWSAATAAGLATCAVFLFHSVQAVSDVLATTWAIASIALARRAVRGPSWSVAAGLAFGVAVLVRPTNALLFPALLVASGLRPRVLAGIALGGVVPAVVHFAVNQLIFSNPLASGYGDIRELMAWRYFLPRLAHYSWWLCVQLSPIVFPAAIVVLAVRKVVLRDRLLLAAWSAPFLIFYCFYSVYEEWWYTRFLLPAIPALLLACAIGLHQLVAEWRPAKATAVATAILIMVLANEIAVSAHFNVLDDAKAEAVYLQASRGAAAILPPNAVVVGMQMSGALYYYTGRTMVRWDWIQPDEFQALRAYAGSRPWYALLADFESGEGMSHTGAAWIPTARFDSVVLYRLDESGAPGGIGANPP